MRGRHPPVLRRGSRVAVTCPSSPVDPERLDRGIARMQALGWEIVRGPSCAARFGLWAGDDDARAAELTGFLRDPSIDAIFAGRGGVGVTRILPRLDDLPAGLPPRWIVGRSDVTALQLALWKKLGWIGLSGPMVATDLGGEAAEPALARALRHLCDPEPLGPVVEEPLAVWTAGDADGILIPANLSLLASLAGTRWIPPLDGAILVLEEIDEPPERIDRMLTQLRLSGALDGLAGLVLGQFTDCRPRDAATPPDVLQTVLRDHARAIGVPALAGLPYGHEPLFHPLPVGVRARLRSDPPGLVLLEAAAATMAAAPGGGGERR